MSAPGGRKLQEAVFARLTQDGALSAMMDIYGHVPDGAALPYLTIASLAGSDWSSKTAKGAEFMLEIHAYSRAESPQPCTDALERVYALLHDAAYTVSGYQLVLSQFYDGSVRRARDGAFYRGVQRYRIVLMQIS